MNFDEIPRLYFGDSERSSLKDCWGSSNQILERWLLDGIVGDCGTISKAARWLMKTVLGCSLAQISFVGLIMIWIPFLGGGSLACWPRFDAHFWVDSTSGLARSSSSISAFARAFLFSKNLLPFLPVSFYYYHDFFLFIYFFFLFKSLMFPWFILLDFLCWRIDSAWLSFPQLKVELNRFRTLSSGQRRTSCCLNRNLNEIEFKFHFCDESLLDLLRFSSSLTLVLNVGFRAASHQLLFKPKY